MATRSADGRTLYLLVINSSSATDVNARLDLQGFVPTTPQAELKRIDSPMLGWQAAWNEVNVNEQLTASLDAPISIPHASVNLLVIHRGTHAGCRAGPLLLEHGPAVGVGCASSEGVISYRLAPAGEG